MAKKGMKRPDRTNNRPRNQLDPVPELQGRAKNGKDKARPIISGTAGSKEKVYHTERPIPSDVYPAVESDPARDHLENNLPAADLEAL